jgi:hypothetical protein
LGTATGLIFEAQCNQSFIFWRETNDAKYLENSGSMLLKSCPQHSALCRVSPFLFSYAECHRAEFCNAGGIGALLDGFSGVCDCPFNDK